MVTRHKEHNMTVTINYNIENAVPPASEITHLKALAIAGRAAAKAAMRDYILTHPAILNNISNFTWHFDLDLEASVDESDDLT